MVINKRVMSRGLAAMVCPPPQLVDDTVMFTKALRHSNY